MKFALFLLCALVAVQGYHARSTADNRELDNVVDILKEIIEKLKQIVENISNELPQLIQNIRDKIKQILDKIPEIVEQIKKKIEELSNLGEAGKKCVAEQRDEIVALSKLARQGVEDCVRAAQEQTAELEQQVTALINKAKSLGMDVANRYRTCYEQNKQNPLGLLKCLKEQVEPVKQQVEELEKEVAKTITLIKKVGQEVQESLKKCVGEVQEKVNIKKQEIVDAITKCIKESN